GAGKADADLVAAEQRSLADAWRVLVIGELALPPAVYTGLGANIIEERVATVDSAVVQHHDAGIAAIDAIKHPNVNGIEAVTDAALSDRSDGWRGLLADGGHRRVEGNARQLRRATFKIILIALLPALERQRDDVGLQQGLETPILVVAQRQHVSQNLAAGRLRVSADECEGRAAAHHLSIIKIENATAGTV